MEFTSNPLFSCERVVRELTQYDKFLGAAIFRNLDRTLREYISEMYSRPLAVHSQHSEFAREKFLRQFRRHLENQLPPARIEDACAELLSHTTLQTGPHSQLLLAPYLFYTSVASYIGLAATGNEYYPSIVATSNKFQTRRGAGAGLLNLAGHEINVFGMSRLKMQKCSVIAASGRFRFALEGRESLEGDLAREFSVIEEMAAGICRERAHDAFVTLNEKIWNRWDPEDTVRPIYLDDRFFASLVAEHLEDETSLLSKLLFTDDRRNRLLSEMLSASKSAIGPMFPNGTDLFWGVGTSRIFELRLSGRTLRKVRGRRIADIPFRRDELRDRLIDGSIIPDVSTIFLVACLIPGFRAMGGFFQVAYLPRFVKILATSLDPMDKEDQALRDGLLASDLSAWGMHVLEEPEDVVSVLARVGSHGLLAKLDREYGSRTLRETTRDLELFRTHLRWKKVFSSPNATAVP